MAKLLMYSFIVVTLTSCSASIGPNPPVTSTTYTTVPATTTTYATPVTKTTVTKTAY